MLQFFKLGMLARLIYAAWFVLWAIAVWAFAEIFEPLDNIEKLSGLLFFAIFLIALSVGTIAYMAGNLTGDDHLKSFGPLRGAGRIIFGILFSTFAFTAYLNAAYEIDFLYIDSWDFLSDGLFLIWSAALLVGGPMLTYFALTSNSRLRESALYRKWFLHGTGGSARFGGPLTFARHQFRRKFTKAPIYLGKTLAKYDPRPFCRHIGVDDENHLVTIAQSRSGKSTTVIWPNLVRYPYPDSVFVLDPKGEHAERTASHRAGQGHQVIVLDPFGETSGLQTHGFNPLKEIDPSSPSAKEALGAIADACIIHESTGDTGQHFDKLQRAMIIGVIAHLLTKEPPERHNLPTVYDFFMALTDPAQIGSFLDAMSKNDACGGAPKEAISLYNMAGSKGEKGGIFTTTVSNLSWVASSGMREHLMRSDFKLSDLRTKKTSLYVVLNFDAMQAQKQGRYMRMLINMAFDACRTTSLPSDRRDRRTLFILDEVAQLGPMPSIENAYRTLAGSHIKIWSFFQNYGALEKNYASPSDLMGNATKQFFGCGDPETAEQIQNYLGSFLHQMPTGFEGQRNLLDASEIRDTLKQNSPMQIVITGDGDKMELKRIRFIPERNLSSVSSVASKENSSENSENNPIFRPDPSQVSSSKPTPEEHRAVAKQGSQNLEKYDPSIPKAKYHILPDNVPPKSWVEHYHFVYMVSRSDLATAMETLRERGVDTEYFKKSERLYREKLEKATRSLDSVVSHFLAGKVGENDSPAFSKLSEAGYPIIEVKTPAAAGGKTAPRSSPSRSGQEPQQVAMPVDVSAVIRAFNKRLKDLHGDRQYYLRRKGDEVTFYGPEGRLGRCSRLDLHENPDYFNDALEQHLAVTTSPETEPVPETPPAENQGEGLTAEHQAALQRFSLNYPFPRAELDGKHLFWLERVPESKVDQVNADYETLLSVAS